MAGRNGFTFRIAVHSGLLTRADVPVVYRCGLAEPTLEGRRQLLRVVRVDVQAFAHPGSGHVGESFVYEVGRLSALGMNDDLVSRCTLRRVTCHRIPVIDVRRLASTDGSRPT